MDLRLLLELFVRFLKIGVIGFGGGWAILPIIEREIVEDAGWLSEDEYYDLVAIAGSTPGPVAVNAATFVGYRLGGVPGALVATSAVIIPPITIILIIAYMIHGYMNNPIVRSVLNILKAVIVGLISLALYSMVREFTTTIIQHKLSIPVYLALTAIVIITIGYYKIHPLIVISAMVLLGIILGIIGIEL
jgi:chromate transporter